MYAVILAGGSGTRFWPLSRELYPKQFLKIAGEKNLLEQAVDRISGLISANHCCIVTNEKLYQDVRGLFPDRDGKGGVRIWVEPAGKNTAPAIGLAAIRLVWEDPDAVMAVLPADHLIKKTAPFNRILRQAERMSGEGHLITLGIKPSGPETGYGYIRAARRALPRVSRGPRIFAVEGFVEKPDRKTAKRYLKSGRYFWNSGIFVWKASVILGEIERHLPGLYKQLLAIRDALGTQHEEETIRQAYRQMDSISIDYGVMEKSDRVVMAEADIGWTDLGSWNAFGDVARLNRRGNVITGNALDLDSVGSIVYADKRFVATIGLDNMIVVDSPDATLVCSKERAQDVKKVVEHLKKQGAQEHYVHRTVHRPWGSYTVLEEDRGYKIKRLMVKPGARLSLQLHRRRSEHWVVVSGTARVTCGERVYDVKTNESTYIPIGARHRIENPGDQPLQIIEVQNGDYLGEDDIERFQDDYGRLRQAKP